MTEQNSALIPIDERIVQFHSDELTAILVQIEEDEPPQVYVPIRPLCNYLGLNWAGQQQRIDRDPVLSEVARSVRISRANSTGGNPNVLALPLDYLNGFLFGINANRVNPEIRENLLRYQRECYRVLANAFLSPGVQVQQTDATNQVLMQMHNMALVIAATTRELLDIRHVSLDNKKRLDAAREYMRGVNERLTTVERQLRAGTLTEEQAAEIKKRVNQIALTMAEQDPSKSHFQTVYTALQEEAGVTSYKSIPPKAYETAVAFLDRWIEAIGGH